MAWVQDASGNWYDDGSSSGTTTDYSSYVDPFNSQTAPTYDPSQGVDYSSMFGLDPNVTGAAPNPQTGANGGADYSQYLSADGPSWLQQLQGYGGTGNTLGALGSMLKGNGSTVGALAGGLAGALGSGNAATQTQSNIPSWATPYYRNYLESAQNLASNTGFNDTQNQAFDRINSLANNQGGINGAATSLATDTMNGKYLNPETNPYLQKTADYMTKNMSDAYARGTGAQTMGQFQNAGAFGGSAMKETQAANNQQFADSLGNSLNSLYGGNYANERSNQLSTMGQTPSLNANQYYGTQQQLAAGTQKQQWPYYQQQMFGNALGAITGTQQSTSASQNPWAAGLGGAITGAKLGGLLGGN